MDVITDISMFLKHVQKRVAKLKTCLHQINDCKSSHIYNFNVISNYDINLITIKFFVVK